MPPVLVLHGEEDRVVPASEARALEAWLAERGSPHEVVIYPGEGHHLLDAAAQHNWEEAGRRAECEIGYSIAAPYEGRGFATEGARALIEYLRGDERLSSVIAHTFPWIPASIRVMEKCGMVFDGEGEEALSFRTSRGTV